VGCDGGPRNNNPRDPKLERQRQQINAAIGQLEAEFDQAALDAKRVYEGAKREALVVQENVERKIEQVDQAAQVYIERSKNLGRLADVASSEAEKAKQTIRGMLGHDSAPQEKTPVPPNQP
jgi:hypothetical protein